MYVIMLLRLTLLVKSPHSFKMASLIHKIILDDQDFGLTTEARPQTAGHAVYVSLPCTTITYTMQLSPVSLKCSEQLLVIAIVMLDMVSL